MKRFYSSKLIILIALLSGWNWNAIAQTSVFSFNGTGTLGSDGSTQTYTVPPGVTSVGIDAIGAAGGSPYIYTFSCSALPKSLGGRVQCVLAVTGGEILYVYVGGQGQNCPNGAIPVGGYNGGGNSSSGFGAGSGGASDVRLSAGTNAGNHKVTPYTSSGTGWSNNRIVVAGGGGGGGDYSYTGGAGGGTTGGTGSAAGCGFGSGSPGSGGTPSGAGPTGTYFGALGVGGGASSSYGPGGGGYWGGNSGISEGGGGGGSSYTDPVLCTSVSHTQGYSGANGNGQVTITVLCNGAGTITGNGLICLGSATPTTALTATAASGGTWSSGATSVAAVGSTGIVTGVGTGTSIITYNVPNPCGGITPATFTVTVNQAPALSGPNNVCSFAAISLATSVPGGVWTSSSNAQATVTAGAGSTEIVTGATPGYPSITYSVGGCSATYPVTVNSGPALITPANAAVCSGGTYTTQLTETSGGGTWSSGATATATVVNSGSAAGLVTGLSAGVVPISYTYITTGCTSITSVTVNALPGLFTVSGGGAYCTGTASPWSVGLSGSAIGVNYQLYLNGSSAGLPALSGTGGALNYGIESSPGIYTVVATNAASGCSKNMSGSATITVNPLPGTFSISSMGNSYCAGGAGDSILLSGSASGISYMLYNGGPSAILTKPGTGSVLNFGAWPAGNYTMTAQNTSTGCANVMTGTVSIVTSPLPTQDSITASNGGAYCSGTAGAHVGLNFSNTGITYLLYHGLTFIDSVGGSNSGLDFGAQTITGAYTAIAVNATTRCSSNMLGTVNVTVNSAPTLESVTGGGSYCPGSAGLPVGISGSDAGAQYQLYNGFATVGGAVSGTGTGFNFGTYTATGIYTITSIYPATGCKDTMTGSITINVNPAPTVYAVQGGGSYCAGGGGKDISLNGSDFGVTYRLYNGISPVDSAIGFGGPLDFSYFTIPGTYTVTAGNGACSANMSGSATIVVNPLPNVDTVSGSGGYCAGTTGRHVGLTFSDAGVNYQLYSTGSPAGSQVPGSGSGLDFGVFPAGAYTVVAINPVTGCSDNMFGAAYISVNPLPLVHNVSGGGEFCAGGTGETISLDESDEFVNYQLYRGVASIGSPVAGTEGSITFGLDTLAGTYTVVATGAYTGCVNAQSGSAVIIVDPLPQVFPLSGGGNYCTGGSGLDIMLGGSDTGISYTLFNAGSPIDSAAGSGASLDFGLQVGNGAYMITATDPLTNCASNMSGSPVINVLPLPAIHNVTGGGTYCSGSSGKAIGLDTSDAGIHYQLYIDGASTGSPLAGTGIALNFGLHTAGTYTIMATNPSSSCSSLMASDPGGVLVTAAPLPNPYSISGGGTYCADGSGVDVSLSPTDAGITYSLYRGTAFIDSQAGGSSVLDFGLQTAGTYTIVASDTLTHCTQNMAGSSVIAINTVNVYTVIGGGGFCLGGPGVHIGQSGSHAGVSYQLFSDGSSIGAPLAGTGAALDFGLDTVAGSYTITATDTTSFCQADMAGSATVVVNPLPSVYNVTGGGSFCAADSGTHVGLNGSDEGINYRLYNGSSSIGAIASGTGSPLDFGLVTGAGGYTAVATNVITGCTSNMADTAAVIVRPLPVAYAVTAENYGNYCSADSGVHINLSSSNAGVAYHLYNGPLLDTTITGTGSALDFGLQVVAGTYTVFANDASTTCHNAMSGSATVYIIPLPIVHNMIGGGGFCPGGPGVDVGLDGSQAGIYYQLYKSGAPVGGLVYGTGVSLDFGIQPAGNYTVIGNSEVVAMGYVTTCPNPMFGSAVVAVDSILLPSVAIQSYPPLGLGVWHVDSIKVFVTNAGPDPTFQWYINGNPIVGATSATFTDHKFFNTDSVSCDVTAVGPCGDLSASKAIVLTLHDEGVQQVSATSGNIMLVPNPNKGVFTVKGTLGTSSDEEVSIEVTNMLGQVVYTNKAIAHNGVIDEQIQLNSTLANGMYIMTLRSGTQNSVVHFVIEQ